MRAKGTRLPAFPVTPSLRGDKQSLRLVEEHHLPLGSPSHSPPHPLLPPLPLNLSAPAHRPTPGFPWTCGILRMIAGTSSTGQR